MAAEFNDLLRSARIAPEEVRLLRHHTDGGLGGMSLFELWRNDRDGYELYQSTQKRNRPLFRTGRYWASFASPAHGETVFTGLYEVSYKDTRVVEWSCPFRGSAVGKGEAVDVFETKLRPELADHIGALHVAWPLTSIRSWARYASNAQLRIVSAGPSQTATPSKNQFLIEALLRSNPPPGAALRLMGCVVEAVLLSPSLRGLVAAQHVPDERGDGPGASSALAA